ncbi:MAG: CHAT domain-containing protein [Oscillatoriales cyanobacterium]|nr:MAG: CHAT domain-containing protein [Oscillatoriales cyanobacterium]
MKPEVARRRIEAFERRFGKTQLIFACHAAFPLALTPDLLYKLWANFQRDIHGFVLGIPWVAVADLLLSSLCDEVGRELYEMDTAVRNSLLNRLKDDENFGQQRINELSDFLLVYVRQQLQSNDQEVRDFAQAQRWTALAYTRPSEAAQELKATLEQAYRQDRAEQVRLASLVETFAEPLAEFEPLLVYAREIGKFAPSDSVRAVAEVSKASPENSQPKYAQEVLTINPSSQKEPTKNNVVGIKTVILTIGDGDFENGFPVVVKIFQANELFPVQQLIGNLPPAPDVYSSYDDWQLSGREFHTGFSHRMGLKRIPGLPTNFSSYNLTKDSQSLQNSINKWLKSESFIHCVLSLRMKLSPTDEVRVFIETENHVLQQLPWHLWDFFEDYPKAEIALSLPRYSRYTKIKKSTFTTNKVRILALLGQSRVRGESINLDVDRSLLEQLSNAETVFLVEPSRDQLFERLWEAQGWDIFYFGGMSSSDSDDSNDRINFNSTDTLKANDLKNALERAMGRGLKLAIFNSCDGLGIGNELANFGSLTTIVMRDQISDAVAHTFLKHFLEAFSSGKSLYASVRETRERLHGLEDTYPGASWLPVIFHNPAEAPPTWEPASYVSIFD